MKKILISTVVAAIAALAPISNIGGQQAYAAPSDRPSKTERAMSRIIQSLKKIESDLNRVQPDTSENTLNGIQKKIDRSRKWLAALPADAEGHEGVENDLDALQSQLGGHLARYTQAADAREGNLEKMKEMLAQSSKEAHYEFMVNADNLASAMEFMDYKHSHMNREDSITQEYKHYATQYPAVFERITELMSFFDGMDERDVRDVFNPSLSQMVRSNGESFKLAKSKLDDFGDNAIAVAGEKITLAGKNARAAIDEDRAADLLSDTSVTDALNYLNNAKTIYTARSDADPATLKKYKALQARANKEVNDVMLEAFNIIVANNPPVSNAFMGHDRATVEAMVRDRWNQAYPEDEILQVRITQQDWVRRREPGWRDGYLIMFEYSIATPYVVVKEKDGLASQWGMVAEKDHLSNEEISISFGRLRNKKLDPLYTVLQSNLA